MVQQNLSDEEGGWKPGVLYVDLHGVFLSSFRGYGTMGPVLSFPSTPTAPLTYLLSLHAFLPASPCSTTNMV